MGDETFIMTFRKNYFNKNDILLSGEDRQLKVIKIYKDNFWRKFLHFLGFKIMLYGEIKVKLV